MLTLTSKQPVEKKGYTYSRETMIKERECKSINIFNIWVKGLRQFSLLLLQLLSLKYLQIKVKRNPVCKALYLVNLKD